MAKALTVASISKLKPDPLKRREVPDGLLAGLYHVIQSSGARSWAVRYRSGGVSKKLTLGSYPALELDDARTAARAALIAVQRGADPAAVKAERRRAERSGDALEKGGFESVVRQYLSRDAKSNRSWIETARLLGLKPSSAGSLDPKTFDVIPKSAVADWSRRPITEIKRTEIIERLDAIFDRGAPIAANRTLAALRRMFNWSIERGLIEVSPCAAVRAPAPERSRDRILNDDEIRWMWTASKSMGYPFGPLFRLLLLTGQRREEVGGMSKAELDGSIWTIPSARSKNDQAHRVPLSSAAFAEIEALPKIASEKRLLFTTTGVTSVSGWSRAKQQIDTAMVCVAREERHDAEFNISNWTLHDLRRTAASGMARLGQPVHVVERLLNHRSGTIRGIAAVYNRHDYWDERVRAAETWASFVVNLVASGGGQTAVPLRGAA